MILGHIKNLKQEKYLFSGNLLKGLEYIQNADLNSLAPGKYEIDGKNVFVLISEYNTEPKQQRKAEAHKKYIDIQYIAKGEENIGHSFLAPDNEVLEDRLEEKDAIFYKTVQKEVDLYLNEGTYGIFFPEDVHRPCCAVGEPAPVRKVVVKILVETLTNP
jgi:YhcH/YjgK/YiaL family protein